MNKTTSPAKQSNRDKYPEMAKRVDEIRELFGDVKILKFMPSSFIGQNKQGTTVEVSLPLAGGYVKPAAPSRMTAKEKKAYDKRCQLEQMLANGTFKLGA